MSGGASSSTRRPEPMAARARRTAGPAGLEPAADHVADLGWLDLRVGHLVADDEQVAAPSPLLEAVDRGVPPSL